jgi:hypothetical protein
MGMVHPKLQHRSTRIGAVVFGLVAALLAIGLAAVVFARATGARSRSSAITGAIHLNRVGVRAGGRIRGQVVFRNRTSRTRVLMHGCKIDGLYGIGVRASDGYVQAPVFSLVGCSPEQEMVARPGRTVYRFKLSATYVACSQSTKDQPPEGSKYWLPLCHKYSRGQADIMPPLPAGKYTALFFPAGEWHGPHVKPATLQVAKKK